MDMHDEHRLNYVAAIKNMDDGIKKVVESLEARNVLDNTIIVFSSDNGGTVGPGYLTLSIIFTRSSIG